MAKAAKAAPVDLTEDDASDGALYSFSEDIGDAEAPEPLPERAYPATITDVEDRQTQDGRPMVQVKYRINEEDYPADYDPGNAPGGKTLSQFLMMDDSAQTRFRLRRFCEAIGAPMSRNMNPKRDWLNLACSVTVKHEEYEGVNRERVQKVEAA